MAVAVAVTALAAVVCNKIPYNKINQKPKQRKQARVERKKKVNKLPSIKKRKKIERKKGEGGRKCGIQIQQIHEGIIEQETKQKRLNGGYEQVGSSKNAYNRTEHKGQSERGNDTTTYTEEKRES